MPLSSCPMHQRYSTIKLYNDKANTLSKSIFPWKTPKGYNKDQISSDVANRPHNNKSQPSTPSTTLPAGRIGRNGCNVLDPTDFKTRTCKRT
uniref:Uncharacterized protein n=1 Tax=Babesia bovis TaxID=5865 RepID=S6B8I2_BABBO|nr:hypothetical protein [Babesia bovis]